MAADGIMRSADPIGEEYVSSLTFNRLVHFLEDDLGIEISLAQLSRERMATVRGLEEAHLVDTAQMAE